MDRNANKIVLLMQKSRMQELMHKYNTKAQAQVHIEHMGADFSDYVVEDANSAQTACPSLYYVGNYPQV